MQQTIQGVNIARVHPHSSPWAIHSSSSQSLVNQAKRNSPRPDGEKRRLRARNTRKQNTRKKLALIMNGMFWWARQDLNLGPTDYESAALTAELRARSLYNILHRKDLVDMRCFKRNLIFLPGATFGVSWHCRNAHGQPLACSQRMLWCKMGISHCHLNALLTH